MGPIENGLWIVNLFLVVVLIARLVSQGLFRRYIWFFCLLFIQGGQTVALLPLAPSTNAYAWVYFVSQPLVWLSYILVVLELYHLALQDHAGLASLSKWALGFGMLVALGIAAVTVPVDLSGPSGRYPILFTIGVIERGLTFSLLLFLVVIIGFLVWMPIQIPRNLVVHAALFLAYYSATAAGLFVRNIVGYELVGVISSMLLSVNNLCLVLWILFLNRKGEETPVTLRKLWRQSDEDQITRQLDAINAFLLRSAGKQDR